MPEKYLGIIATSLIAAVYLSGFGYLNGYYGVFGVAIQELSVGVQEISAYALTTLRSVAEDNLLLLILVALVSLFVQLARSTNGTPQLRLDYILFSTAITLVVLLVFDANRVGRENAHRDIQHLDIFSLNGSALLELAKIGLDVDTIRWHHLYSNSNTAIAVGIFTDSGYNQGSADAWVVRFNTQDWVPVAVYVDSIGSL